MGIWAGIKHALNSSLGTNDFRPLNEIIYEGKTILASEEPLYMVASNLPSVDAETSIKTTFKMLNSGSITVTSYLRNSDSIVYILLNGSKMGRIKGGDSFEEKSYTISFSKGDVLSFSYMLKFNEYIKNITICGTVKDVSPIRIVEG